MNVCEPVFDRFLITDTFACRRGKGKVAAVTGSSQGAIGDLAREYGFTHVDGR